MICCAVLCCFLSLIWRFYFALIRNKDTPLLEEPNVVEIAKKYNRTPAQVLLRHGIQRGIVMLVKTEDEFEMKSNLQV